MVPLGWNRLGNNSSILIIEHFWWHSKMEHWEEEEKKKGDAMGSLSISTKLCYLITLYVAIVICVYIV